MPIPGGNLSPQLMSPQHDLSRVRVHEGAPAAETSRAINASAYTQGSDINFAPGEYSPSGASGDSLLGHELTHVVQQRGGLRAIQDAVGNYGE